MAHSNRAHRQQSAFSAWYDLMVHTREMALASAQVITRRIQLMADASSKPSLAHMREFGLMWFEKADAAKRTGRAVTVRDVARSLHHGSALCRRLADNGRDTLSLTQSRTPAQFISRYMQLLTSTGRTVTAMASAAEATARSTKKVMAPYHSTSTRNAARLKKVTGRRN